MANEKLQQITAFHYIENIELRILQSMGVDISQADSVKATTQKVMKEAMKV